MSFSLLEVCLLSAGLVGAAQKVTVAPMVTTRSAG